MDIHALIKSLPDHWRVINVGDSDDDHWDDGRDYKKPMFIRKDGLARIYFNEGERNAKYRFAIAFDTVGDGDCRETLEMAIKVSDEYVEQYIIRGET